MTTHPTTVEGFDGTMEELAEKVARLRYDSLRDFLRLLSHEVRTDAEKDSLAGRRKLGNSLFRIMLSLKRAEEATEEAWRISSPYMEETIAPPTVVLFSMCNLSHKNSMFFLVHLFI
jgi:hypothetical protein